MKSRLMNYISKTFSLKIHNADILKKSARSFSKIGSHIASGIRKIHFEKISRQQLSAAGIAALDYTCRFLYVCGIQSIRILKRVRRRLSKFFSPVTNLCKRVYAATVGRQIHHWKEEFQNIRKGYSKAVQSIHEAKSAGFWPAVKESLQIFFRSFIKYRHIAAAVLNVVVPVVSITILFFTMNYWRNLTFSLQLSNNGVKTATIADESVYEDATEMVKERMVYDTTDSEKDLTFSPNFVLCINDGSSDTSANGLCDDLIQQSNGIIEEASGLYVNGQLLGVVKSSADLRYLLQSLLNDALNGDTDASSSFVDNVEITSGLFPTVSIISSDNMKKILTGTSKAGETYVVQTGDTITSIARVHNTTISDLNTINGGNLGDSIYPGDIINLEVAVPTLSIQVAKTETYESPISFNTITQTDDSQYTDYSKVITDGVTGVEQCVDKVYYVNGIETKREAVSRTVETEAVDKVVVVGTKKRSSGNGISSGTLMWPVPSLHMITTYFTWRWGKFHPGIDISGPAAYGKTIVAADGGVVIAAGDAGDGYGNKIVIDHRDGLKTLYGHTSKILVSVGQNVSKGQAIGLVGSSGYSTGAHCHFEVWKNDAKVNPLSYVSN